MGLGRNFTTCCYAIAANVISETWTEVFYGGMLLVDAVCCLTTIKVDPLPTHGKYHPAKLRDRVSCLRIKCYLPAAV